MVICSGCYGSFDEKDEKNKSYIRSDCPLCHAKHQVSFTDIAPTPLNKYDKLDIFNTSEIDNSMTKIYFNRQAHRINALMDVVNMLVDRINILEIKEKQNHEDDKEENVDWLRDL